jgi:hypothetical protein
MSTERQGRTGRAAADESWQDDAGRCRARTVRGERCRNRAGPSGLCARHQRRLEEAGGGGSPREGEKPADPFAPFLDWAEEALGFLRRRLTGEYQVDEFGHDPDLVEHVLAPLLRPLYRHWWSATTPARCRSTP